jgi:hypothetical protein
MERYDIESRIYDLASGRSRADPLGDYEAPMAEVTAVRLTSAGAVALVDRVDGHVRIRALDAQGDRVLDAEPGIDPASLTVAGSTVSWTRGGATQSATLQ